MDYQFLSQTMLFSGESPEEIKEMLSCLGAVTRSYGKGEIIYHAGECVHSMGLVLSGNVQIESDDVWGNHSVLDDITPGFFFCRNLCESVKRTSDGQCGLCGCKDRSVIFKYRTAAYHLHKQLHTSQPPDPQFVFYFGTEKSAAFAQNLPHHTKVNPRAAALLSVCAVCCRKQS